MDVREATNVAALERSCAVTAVAFSARRRSGARAGAGTDAEGAQLRAVTADDAAA